MKFGRHFAVVAGMACATAHAVQQPGALGSEAQPQQLLTPATQLDLRQAVRQFSASSSAESPRRLSADERAQLRRLLAEQKVRDARP
jgi:hypothetical protein